MCEILTRIKSSDCSGFCGSVCPALTQSLPVQPLWWGWRSACSVNMEYDMSPWRATVFRLLSWAPSDVQGLHRGSSQVQSCSLVLAIGYLASRGLSLLEPNTIHRRASLASTHPARTLATLLSHRGGIVGPKRSGAESLVARQKLRAFSTGCFWISGPCHEQQSAVLLCLSQ